MDVLDGCSGVGGRLIGHEELGRNRQVSGNGGMGGSGQVIGGAGASGRTSERTIGHDAQTQRGAGRSGQTQRGTGRSGQTQRGETFFFLVLMVKLLLLIVWKLQAIKYKNDDRVAQWLKTSQATSGQVG